MKPRVLYAAFAILHMGTGTLCRMNPGMFYDLVQLHNDRLPKTHGDE